MEVRNALPSFVMPFILVLGLVWGSFANVLISRVPKGESISGRSHCPGCGHLLSPLDLIPVASYVLLGGRCRYCRVSISPRYALVEALFALAFLLILGQVGLNPIPFILYVTYVTIALVILFVDFEHAIIPNSLTVTGVAAAIAAAAFQIDPSGPGLAYSLIGGAIGGGFFALLYLATRGGGLGMGDVKLAVFMGLALGPFSLLLAVLLGSVLGLIMAGFVMLRFRRDLANLKSVSMHMNQECEPDITERIWGMMLINGRPALPFGSFLSLGFLVSLFWGDLILRCYFGFWL